VAVVGLASGIVPHGTFTMGHESGFIKQEAGSKVPESGGDQYQTNHAISAAAIVHSFLNRAT